MNLGGTVPFAQDLPGPPSAVPRALDFRMLTLLGLIIAPLTCFAELRIAHQAHKEKPVGTVL